VHSDDERDAEPTKVVNEKKAASSRRVLGSSHVSSFYLLRQKLTGNRLCAGRAVLDGQGTAAVAHKNTELT
jgi:hypothetical protein